MEPNNLPFGDLWQNLHKKWNAQIQEQSNCNKMLKYFTNSNLRLLTQKLLEEAKGLDWNVPVFSETLKRAHQHICGNKDK